MEAFNATGNRTRNTDSSLPLKEVHSAKVFVTPATSWTLLHNSHKSHAPSWQLSPFELGGMVLMVNSTKPDISCLKRILQMRVV